jgi:hypothetical protein
VHSLRRTHRVEDSRRIDHQVALFEGLAMASGLPGRIGLFEQSESIPVGGAMDADAEREVIEGDPALVTDDNFSLTFVDEDSLRALLEGDPPPPGTIAIVRRAVATSSEGAEWDLYAHGWDPWGPWGPSGPVDGEMVLEEWEL